MCGLLLQLSLPVAHAGTFDARYSGITPNTSSFTSWATGGIGVPGYFVFDTEGNAWGIKSAGTGTGQCIVKVTPNANGTSGTVSAIYGAAGTCSSLVVTEGTAVYETLGRTGASATSVAWIDLTHLGIGTANGIYSWDISVSPSTASLTRVSTANASKLAFDGSQNAFAVQSSTGSATGSQIKVKRFSLTDSNDSSTVYSVGDSGISCPSIGNIALSISGVLYISCPRGGSQFNTVQVNLSSGIKSLFSDFAGGPMTIDASGSIYIVGVLDAFTYAYWPTVTKLSTAGTVQSYWTYDVTGDRTEIAIDLAGNIYSLNGGKDTISKLFGTSIPFAPIRVSGSAGPNSALVSWFKPGVTGLETYTATASPGGQSCVTVWPSASCTISGLTNGTTYSVSVQASNRNGTSAGSAAVNVIPLSVPDSPTAASVSLATSTSALITFTAPANNGGVVIDSYTVTSTPDSITAYVLGSSSGSATLSGLRPGVTYAFGVQAGNSRGLSTISNSVTLKIPKSPVLGVWPDISKNKADSAFSLIPPSESYTATGTFTYSSSNTGVISISGDLATIIQAGSAVITTTFNPSDTATYLSGVTKTLTITVTAATNTITFAAIENRATTASPFNLTAISTGGTVSFSSVSPISICTVSSAGRVDLYSAGSCSITASSTGNLMYGAALDVTQVFTVIAPSSVSKPIVLGPPPSAFVVVASPKISRSGASLVCSSGTYKFKKQGGREEASSITSQLISLLSNGGVVDSEKTLGAQAAFDLKSSYKGTTMSCEVGIQQEEVIKTYSSLDKEGISAFEAAMTSAIYVSNTTYYSERDMAYMKRDAGDTKLWKEMLDKALAKREDTKVQAGLDYVANLEKAGISILIARDKVAPVPTPTPVPTPIKSPDVSVTGNVQPAAMKKVGTIYFASGTYFLNDESKKTIKALASSIFMKSPATVLSYGFTDSKGGTDNTLLSQNRAKAVAKLLRSLLPGQKIATGWYASSKPAATGNSKAALAKNRRVEIYIK